MKTLHMALALFTGSLLLTTSAYAQEPKKESNQVTIKMQVEDDDGNIKKIDTTFTVKPGDDIAEIVRGIKQKSGIKLGDMEAYKAFEKLKFYHGKHDIYMPLIADSIKERMFVLQQQFGDVNSDLRKALEELKVELENVEINEEAMQKLDKAMQALDNNQLLPPPPPEILFKDLKNPFSANVNVIVLDDNGDTLKTWGDGREKKIKVTIHTNDSDTLRLENNEDIVVVASDAPVWYAKDGKKQIRKEVLVNGNTVFFGDEEDLKMLPPPPPGAEQRVIVKRLPAEYAKGETIFISDDMHMVKEFTDKDGKTHVYKYYERGSKGEKGNAFIMMSSANEKELASAAEKGIYDDKSKVLSAEEITMKVEGGEAHIQAYFKDKGKLSVTLFDEEMNEIWSEDYGKVTGAWSTTLPSVVKEKLGTYFLRFNHGKQTKLYKLVYR